MTRRLLTSHLRHLLNPATTHNPKPFSFPSSQQNPLCHQTHFLSYIWQLKPNRNLYLSAYKPSEFLLSAGSRYVVQMGRLLARRVWLLCFSLQRQGCFSQRPLRGSWSHDSHQIMNPDSMVSFLIGANVAVYILWKIMDFSFMTKHFLISLDNFKNGQLHTIITSAFSDIGSISLIINMLILESFGRPIAYSFGPNVLLQLYLGGAVIRSIIFLVKHTFLNPHQGYRRQDAISMGPDASLHALICFCLFLPENVVHPVALIFGSTWVILMLATDLWMTKKGKKSPNPSLAGLGGALVGILVCARFRRRM